VAGRPRNLSAGYTPFVKWGLPGIFLVSAISYFIEWMSYLQTGAYVPPAIIVYVFGSIGLTVWLAASCLRLKRVALTEDALHVSGAGRQIVVPLREVVSVGYGRLGFRSVIIRLARDTEFGSRIAFLPKRSFGGLFWHSPIVDRLRDAVAAAKATKAPF
jgi:hypothetical protein